MKMLMTDLLSAYCINSAPCDRPFSCLLYTSYEDNGNLSVSSEMEYKSESVGIGLALSRSIITQFNGTIKVTSEVGQGTSFDIRFYKAIV